VLGVAVGNKTKAVTDIDTDKEKDAVTEIDSVTKKPIITEIITE